MDRRVGILQMRDSLELTSGGPERRDMPPVDLHVRVSEVDGGRARGASGRLDLRYAILVSPCIFYVDCALADVLFSTVAVRRQGVDIPDVDAALACAE